MLMEVVVFDIVVAIRCAWVNLSVSTLRSFSLAFLARSEGYPPTPLPAAPGDSKPLRVNTLKFTDQRFCRIPKGKNGLMG